MSQLATIELSGVRLKSILVATDLTVASERALDYAVSIARQFEAKVHLVHVVKALNAAGDGESTAPTAIAQRDAALLERKLILSGKLKGIGFHVFVREGDIWQQIEYVMRREGANMIVVGTHGRTGLAKLVMGSVAEKVSRLASIPVLTVGNNCETPESERDDSPVLFPTDFSDASLFALPYAVALASHRGSKLVLLHLLPPTPQRDEQQAGGLAYRTLDDTAFGPAREQLEYLAKQCAGADAVCKLDVTANTAEGILKAADQMNAHTIVMGLHHKTFVDFSAHLPWSTAYDVIRLARCPVLTVKE